MQKGPGVQETPTSCVPDELVGLGVGWIDHPAAAAFEASNATAIAQTVTNDARCRNLILRMCPELPRGESTVVRPLDSS